MKPRHTATLALVRVGIIVALVGVPIGALFFLYFGPIDAQSAALIKLADLPNLLLVALFNHWMNVDNKLFWMIILSAFPVLAWGTVGFLIARRI
jgi:uncharacterized membrane protein